MAACAPAGILNALIPGEGYGIETDLAYGEHPRQRADVYRPGGPAQAAPVVVFFYGGSWQGGERGHYRFVGEALASEGVMVVVPDYRVWPDARFPDFIEDGARAVAWVRAEIGYHGGDPDQIYLMGHSAGAHIAALLALDPRYLARAGVNRGVLAGLIGLAGPYDFLPLRDETLKRIFEVPDMAQTQPITFVDGEAPPALLLHGQSDVTVLPRNSARLAQALEAAGVAVEHREYANLGHIGLVLALAAPLRWLAPVRAEVVRFVRQRVRRA
jgi:acetyl esterase/lipase